VLIHIINFFQKLKEKLLTSFTTYNFIGFNKEEVDNFEGKIKSFLRIQSF
jgi:hypothetical protein